MYLGRQSRSRRSGGLEAGPWLDQSDGIGAGNGIFEDTLAGGVGDDGCSGDFGCAAAGKMAQLEDNGAEEDEHCGGGGSRSGG